ncbi:hypothetical protein DF113_33505 [Burkholderia stagnalis]|nr:hypothetical protein DF113_33505 [Burkholderia stagnalis]
MVLLQMGGEFLFFQHADGELVFGVLLGKVRGELRKIQPRSIWNTIPLLFFLASPALLRPELLNNLAQAAMYLSLSEGGGNYKVAA